MPLYDLITGVNPSASLAIKTDTQERMMAWENSLANTPKFQTSFAEPDWNALNAQFMVSKNYGVDDLLSSTDDWYTKAIEGTDPIKAQEAFNMRDKQLMQNSVLARGIATNTTFDKEPWMDKYLSKPLGLNLDQGQAENDNRYYEEIWQKKTMLGKAVLGTGQFLARTIAPAATKFAEGFGYLGSMLVEGGQEIWDSKNNNFWAGVADNAWSRSIGDMEQSFKDQIIPVYKSINYDNQGFFGKLGDAAFWTDEFADGAAFLLSAAIPGGVFSKLGKGVSIFGRLSSKAGVLGNVARGVEKGSKFLLGSSNRGAIGQFIYNTANEAGFEAVDTFKETKEHLKELNPDWTDDMLNNVAGEKAANTFGYNIMVLGLSNAWEQRAIWNPIFKITDKTGAPIKALPGGVAKSTVKAAKTTFRGKALETVIGMGKKTIKGTLAEGFWEENMQLAAQRMASDTYMRKDEYGSTETDTNDSFWLQGLTQAFDALVGRDYEASTSIGMGGLLGGGASIITSKMAKRPYYDINNPTADPIYKRWGSESESDRSQANVAVARINNAAAAYLSSVDNIWEKDAQGNWAQDTESMNALRKVQLAKFSENMKSLSDIEALKSDGLRETNQLLLLQEYINATEWAGKTEQFMTALKDTSNFTEEQIQTLGYNPKVTKMQLSDMQRHVSNFVEMRSKAFDKEGIDGIWDKEAFKGLNTEQIYQKRINLKNKLYGYAATAYVYQPHLDEIKGESSKHLETINKILNSINPTTINGDPTKALELSNKVENTRELANLHTQKIVLEEKLKDDLPDFYKTILEEELKDVNSEIEKTSKEPSFFDKNGNLKDITDFTLGKDAQGEDINLLQALFNNKLAENSVNSQIQRSEAYYKALTSDDAFKILDQLTTKRQEKTGAAIAEQVGTELQASLDKANAKKSALLKERRTLKEEKELEDLMTKRADIIANFITPKIEALIANGAAPEDAEKLAWEEFNASSDFINYKTIVDRITELNKKDPFGTKVDFESDINATNKQLLRSKIGEVYLIGPVDYSRQDLLEKATMQLNQESSPLINHKFHFEQDGVSYDVTEDLTDNLTLHLPAPTAADPNALRLIGELKNFMNHKFIINGYEVPVNELTAEEFNIFFRMDVSPQNANEFAHEQARIIGIIDATSTLYNNIKKDPKNFLSQVSDITTGLAKTMYNKGQYKAVTEVLKTPGTELIGTFDLDKTKKDGKTEPVVSALNEENRKILYDFIPTALPEISKSGVNRYHIVVRVNGELLLLPAKADFYPDLNELFTLIKTTSEEVTASIAQQTADGVDPSKISTVDIIDRVNTEIKEKLYIGFPEGGSITEMPRLVFGVGPSGDLRLTISNKESTAEKQDIKRYIELDGLKNFDEVITAINKNDLLRAIFNGRELTKDNFKVNLPERDLSISDINLLVTDKVIINNAFIKLIPKIGKVSVPGKSHTATKATNIKVAANILKGGDVNISNNIFESEEVETTEEELSGPLAGLSGLANRSATKVTSVNISGNLNKKESTETKDEVKSQSNPVSAVVPEGNIAPFDPNEEIIAEDNTEDFKILHKNNTNDRDVTTQDIQIFKNWVLTNFPADLFTVEEINTVGDNLANQNVIVGRFLTYLDNMQLKGKITTYNGQYMYHEAFHGVFRLLMDQTTQDQAIAAGLKEIYTKLNKEGTTLINELEKFKLLHPKYNSLSKEELKRLYVEEYIADEFQKYKDSQTDNRNKPQNFFSRLFERILAWLNNFYVRKDSLQQLFKDIDGKKFKRTTVQENSITNKLLGNPALAEKLEAFAVKFPIKIQAIGNQPERTEFRYLSKELQNFVLGTVYTNFLLRTEKSQDLTKIELLNQVLGEVKQALYEELQTNPTDVNLLSLNYALKYPPALDTIIEEVNNNLKYAGYTGELDSDAILEELEQDEFGSIRNQGDLSLNVENLGGFASLASDVKRYLASITEDFSINGANQRGEIIYKKQINVAEIYNAILKSTTDAIDSQDWNSKLDLFAKYNPGSLIARVKEDLDVQRQRNPVLANTIEKGFMTVAKHYILPIFNPSSKQVLFTNLNTADSAQTQYRVWANDLSVKRPKPGTIEEESFNKNIIRNFSEVSDVLKNIKLLFPDINDVNLDENLLELAIKSSKQINAISGFNISPMYFMFTFHSLLETGEPITNLYSNIEILSPTVLSELRESIIKGEDPSLAFFGSDTHGAYGARTRLMELAKANSMFDLSIMSTVFRNVENKLIYTHQFPNFNSREFIKIQRAGGNNTVMGNDVAFQNALPYLKHVRHGGFKIESVGEQAVDNKTFRNFTPRELMMSHLSYYLYNDVLPDGRTTSRHHPRILGDSSTADIIELPIMNAVNKDNTLSKDFKVKLSALLHQELNTIKDLNESDEVLRKINDGNTNQTTNDFYLLKDIMEVEEATHLAKEKQNPTGKSSLKSILLALTKNDSIGAIENLSDEMLQRFYDAAQIQLTSAINNYIAEMQKLGLIEVLEDGSISNISIPEAFFEENSTLNFDKDFRHNLSQFFLNDYLNTTLFNDMMYGGKEISLFKGGYLDIIKRAQSSGGAGPSLAVTTIAPELGIFHKMEEFYAIVRPDMIKTSSVTNDNQETQDGQSYATVKWFRYLLHSLGRLNKRTAEILDKIERGEEVDSQDIFGQEGTIKLKRQGNSQKIIFYDSTGLFKMSTTILTKKQTSLRRSDGTWEAQPGNEWLHDLREEMEGIEAGKMSAEDNALAPELGKVVLIVSESASKTRTKLSENRATNTRYEDLYGNIDSMEAKDAYSIRLQQENPSNKGSIPQGSQMSHILDTEQGRSEVMQALIAEYQSANAEHRRLGFVEAIRSIFVSDNPEFSHAVIPDISLDGIGENKTVFKEMILEIMENSGTSQQIIDYVNNDFDLNTPESASKFDQLFFSILSKGGFQTKVPGESLALVATLTKKVKTARIDDFGNFVWDVIPNSNLQNRLLEDDNYSSTFVTQNEGETDNDYLTRIEALVRSGEDVTFVDKLRHNVPLYDEKTGELLEHFTEVMIPNHWREIALMQEKGQDINMELFKAFGVRIPSQAQHSALTMRIVDFSPAFLGSNIYAPEELAAISGADYDIDKLYSHFADIYFEQQEDGTYSINKYTNEGKTDQEKFDQYTNYVLKNNKDVKRTIRQLKNDSPLWKDKKRKLTKQLEEKKKLFKEYKKILEATWEKYDEAITQYNNLPGPKKKFNFRNVVNEDVTQSIERLKEMQDEIGIDLSEEIAYFETQKAARDIEFNIEEDLTKLGLQERLFRTNSYILRGKHEQAKLDFNNAEDDMNFIILQLQEELSLISQEFKELAFNENYFANTLDKFIELTNKYGEQNKGVLNNRILDSSTRLLSNPEIVAKGIDKAPATTKNFSRWENTTNKIMASKLNKEAVINPNSPLGKFKHFEAINTGGENIAPAVNTEIYYTFFRKYDIRAAFPIKIGGNVYSSFSSDEFIPLNPGDPLERKFEYMSEAVTAMTDNLKLALAHKFSLNKDSLAALQTLYGLGIHPDLAINLIISDEFKDFFIEGKQLSDLATPNDYILSKDDILNHSETDLAKGARVAILQKVKSITDTYTHLNRVLKLNKGIKNVYAMQNMATAAEVLGITKEVNKNFPLKGIKEGFNKHFSSQMLGQMQEISKIAPKYLLSTAQVTQNVLNNTNFIFSQMKRSMDKEQIYTNTRNNFYSFLQIKSYLADNPKVIKIMNGDLFKEGVSAANKLRAMGGLFELQHGYKSKLLTRYLYTSFQNIVAPAGTGKVSVVANTKNLAGADLIASNSFTSLDASEIAELQDEFLQIYNSVDPVLYQYGRQLFAYLLVKDGFLQKQGTYSSFIHPSLKKTFINSITPFKDIFANKDFSKVADMTGQTLPELLTEFYKLTLQHPNYSRQIRKFNPGSATNIFKSLDADSTQIMIEAQDPSKENTDRLQKAGHQLIATKDNGIALIFSPIIKYNSMYYELATVDGIALEKQMDLASLQYIGSTATYKVIQDKDVKGNRFFNPAAILFPNMKNILTGKYIRPEREALDTFDVGKGDLPTLGDFENDFEPDLLQEDGLTPEPTPKDGSGLGFRNNVLSPVVKLILEAPAFNSLNEFTLVEKETIVNNMLTEMIEIIPDTTVEDIVTDIEQKLNIDKDNTTNKLCGFK